MQETNRPLRCQMCALAPKIGTAPCTFMHAQMGAGEALIEQGVTPTRVVYLRRGYVVLSAGAAGRDVSCAVRGPDTMFGLEGVFAKPVPYGVRALTDVALCFLDVESYRTWIGPLDSPLGATLRFALEECMRKAGERQSMEGTALRRVARLLLQTGEIAQGRAPNVPLGVLAQSLGMRPETLSRALAELRALGALSGERQIRILDAEKLRLVSE